MRLKKKTKNIIKYTLIIFMIIAMLLPLVANFLPQQQAQQIDPELLQAYIESQNTSGDDSEVIEMPDIEGTYQVVDVPTGNTITVMWGDEERDVKLIGVKEVSLTKKALEKKIDNELVQLEFDAEEEDENGTLLAYAYHPDGTFINRDLILHGDAKVETNVSENTRYLVEFEDAQIAAKGNQVGCWAEDTTSEDAE